MTMMVASAGLEREVPGLPAPAPGVRRLGEQAADLVERPGIGRGCRSRVLADRRGVDLDDLADVACAGSRGCVHGLLRLFNPGVDPPRPRLPHGRLPMSKMP